MALNLKKLGKIRDVDPGPSGQPPGDAERRASPPASSGGETRQIRRDPWRGRKVAPPAPGSGYGEFLDWASEGGLPAPSDFDLAAEMWLAPGSVEEPPAVPGMR